MKAWRLVANLSCSQIGELRATNYRTTRWLISVNSSGRACRNNLHRDVHCRVGTLISHQVYVPATYVGEALARVVDDGRAVGTVSLVHRKLPSHDRNEARTGMGMPSGVLPRLERVFGHIKVRVTSHPGVEKPIRQIASTHHVEQPGRKVSGVRSVYRLSRVQKILGDDSAVGRRQDWRRRQCDESRRDDK